MGQSESRDGSVDGGEEMPSDEGDEQPTSASLRNPFDVNLLYRIMTLVYFDPFLSISNPAVGGSACERAFFASSIAFSSWAIPET